MSLDSHRSNHEALKKPKKLEITDFNHIAPKDVDRVRRTALVLIGKAALSNMIAHFGNDKLEVDADFIRNIRDFQLQHGLKPDGIPWELTYKKMMSPSDSVSTNPPSRVHVTLPSRDGSKELIHDEKMVQNHPEWRAVYSNFQKHLTPQEQQKLAAWIPSIIVNGNAKTGAYIVNGEIIETFPVLLGKNWVVPLDHSSRIADLQGKGSTAANIVYHFDGAKIPKNPNDKASINKNTNGVVGAALFSPEGRNGGGRWFHGVLPDAETTHGCVGMPVEVARKMAESIRSHKMTGFGYVDYNTTSQLAKKDERDSNT